jgi:hypothetical protein
MSEPEIEPDSEPDGSRRRAALVLLAMATVAVVVAGGVYWAASRGSNSPRVPAAAPQPTSPPVVGPTVTTTPSRSPSSTPTPHRTRHRVPHQVVAAANPTGFRYRGKGYTIKATVCGMPYVRPLDPPGEQHHTVCWVEQDFGHAPGTNGQGTTYLLGHAWAEDRLEVLNRISQPATRQILQHKARSETKMRSGVATYPVTTLDGDVLTLHTANGVLHYTVRDAYGVAKEQAGFVHSLMAQNTKHRVVLITCAERHGVDYDYNIIVEAYLTSSVAAKSRT